MQLRPCVAVDIGTDTIRARGPSGRFFCPSRTIQSVHEETITAVGKAAQKQNLTDDQLLVRPIQSGVLAHYSGGQALLDKAISSVLSWWTIFRPTVVISRSQLASAADVRQLKQAAQAAGARFVYTADVCALTALGAGISPQTNAGHLVVDCGAGSCEAAVIVRGNSVVSEAIPVGGSDAVECIRQYISDYRQATISRKRAHDILGRIGSALPKDTPESITVSSADGKSVTITTNDVAEAINSRLTDIADMIQALMRQMPAALLADVGKNGVLLSGGLARLDNLSTYLQRRLSVSVTVADRPRQAVVGGAWQALSFVPIYRKHIQYSSIGNYFQ